MIFDLDAAEERKTIYLRDFVINLWTYNFQLFSFCSRMKKKQFVLNWKNAALSNVLQCIH